jgi:hypothetical protein
MDPEGPVQCGGPFGGFATEGEFYRSFFSTDVRNNPFGRVSQRAALRLIAGMLWTGHE